MDCSSGPYQRNKLSTSDSRNKQKTQVVQLTSFPALPSKHALHQIASSGCVLTRVAFRAWC